MFKQFFGYFKNYKKYLYLSAVFVILETLFELIIPLIMADIIDIGVANKDRNYILIKGGLMIICALLSLGLGLLYAKTAAKAGQGFGYELRKAQYQKIQEFSFKNTDHFSTSSLVTRLTSDVTILQNAICNGIRPLVRAPFMMLTALTMAILINAKLAVVFLIAIPVLATCLIIIMSKVRPLYGKMQRALDSVNSIVQENLIAIRVVKSYVRKDYEQAKFNEVNLNYQQVSRKSFHYAVMNMPCFQFVMYSTIIAILWFGGRMIQVGNMQVGELTGFLSYIMQILNSLMMISNVFLMLTRSLASAYRIQEVFDEEIDIKDEKSDIKITRGKIIFKNVAFKYDLKAKEYVLNNINLEIEPGETVGIIGGTGSAKTSLVQLIPRLYDITAGDLLIDGHDIKSYGIEHLRDEIAMVLQKNTLFSGTIKENILWGKADASDHELNEVLDIACASEFIDALPKGINTDLGQGGVNVSGGQKQRLCIARALLKKPKILILDDSTSALDTATERKLTDGLAYYLPKTTKIIISQRLSSLAHADKIVILTDGKIDDIGTPEELANRNHIYQDLCKIQEGDK
ncbi:ABC transporter ATP-binding protein/permease [Erysipelatoclostridium ramosum]|uniref:ABC transporter ATP-binding protein n=1 Tax=Thomasclavelia ramosa TaxID=1547 RepID=UPI00192B9E6B|nr:ABC transporter ATP-binding protein [Thomasclavelia ramosa]MCR1947362.1 ABC transporter ATP-binding protein/permease [Thomasclavelia ramosa]QQY29139.1 ABC transporter ATP-binding protein [Thomasclavelia ramosa]